MEAELLREMIADREQQIALVQRKSEEQREKELRLCQELEDVSQQNLSQQITHQTEKTRLLHARQKAEQRLEQTLNDLQQQGSSLKMYAGVIKQEQMSDSSFVMRMQAQLCKAMHSMGIFEHQLEIVKTQSESIVKFHKDTIAGVTEEKSQVELEMMNELIKADNERRSDEKTSLAKLGEIRREADAVERKIEENQEDDEEEEGEKDGATDDKAKDDDDQEKPEQEEDEHEIREAKEELMNMLKEKRDDIDRLEKETEEQFELIQELEEQVQELGGDTSEIVKETPRPQVRKETAEKQSNGQTDDLFAEVQRRLAQARLAESNNDDEDEDEDEDDEEETETNEDQEAETTEEGEEDVGEDSKIQTEHLENATDTIASESDRPSIERAHEETTADEAPAVTAELENPEDAPAVDTELEPAEDQPAEAKTNSSEVAGSEGAQMTISHQTDPMEAEADPTPEDQ